MTEHLTEQFKHYGRSEYITPDMYFIGGIWNPEKLDTLERITESDKSAERIIQAAEQLIQDLQSYRRDLYILYNDMQTAQIVYDIHIQLTRRKDYYHNKVYYAVCVFKGYRKNGQPFEKIIDEDYKGKERHTAIARYKALQKQYPQAIARMNIEKSKWER